MGLGPFRRAGIVQQTSRKDFCGSRPDLTEDQVRFMWSQILMGILLGLSQTSKSKKELIEERRRQYKHNIYQQNKIIEFENTLIKCSFM
ncbi:unnamed protein product, partial [Didymodactylos carnosus]